MLTKTELKYFSSLLIKKFRNNEKKILVEGPKLIAEAIEESFPCESIITTKIFYEENQIFFRKYIPKKIRIEIVKTSDLEKLSDTKNSQGIVAVFAKKNPSKDKIRSSLVVALENISDSGNMGTIIRNCDWFGIESVLLSDNCSEIYAPKVIRASAGSVFHMNIREETDFYKRINELKMEGYHILCADLDGINLYELEKIGKCVIVFANEANGPTKELLSFINQKVTIPGRGKAESLNVASASAVILSELTREKT